MVPQENEWSHGKVSPNNGLFDKLSEWARLEFWLVIYIHRKWRRERDWKVQRVLCAKEKHNSQTCMFRSAHPDDWGERGDFRQGFVWTSKTSEFGASEDENIQNFIVIDILNMELSLKLQFTKMTLHWCWLRKQSGSLKMWLCKSTCKERQRTWHVKSLTGAAKKYTAAMVSKKKGNRGQCRRCGKVQHNRDENCQAKVRMQSVPLSQTLRQTVPN